MTEDGDEGYCVLHNYNIKIVTIVTLHLIMLIHTDLENLINYLRASIVFGSHVNKSITNKKMAYK